MDVLEKKKGYLRMEPLRFLCCLILIRGAALGTQSDDDDVWYSRHRQYL